MLEEFRKFAMRGNVVDLAVGIVLGVAFGGVITSLVDDVVMPPIGWLLGRVNFSDLFWVIEEGQPAGPYASLALAGEAGAVTINYGQFVNTIVNFLIVAFAMFLLVRTMNRLERPKEETAPETKECPYCYLEIPLQSKRCPHCTSEL